MSNHRVLRVSACLQGLQTLPLAGKVVTKKLPWPTNFVSYI